MRLYYMTSYEVALIILRERRMRLARFDRLNDPFELLSTSIADREVRYVMKYLRDHWVSKIGIICMGLHWKSPVMWAHYARNHTGICLGFDVPDELAREVKYSSEREKVVLDMTKEVRGITSDLLERITTTKYAQWSYEEEWRLFARLEEKDPVNGEYYLPFGPSMTLREVIVGVRCKASVGSFRKIIGRAESEIKIIRVRPAFDSFAMVQQRNVTPIKILPRSGARD